jgi:hypothetical protein
MGMRAEGTIWKQKQVRNPKVEGIFCVGENKKKLIYHHS